MSDATEKIITKEEQEEIKEFISIVLTLPTTDKVILLSNAKAFKTLRDIEKQQGTKNV